MIETKMTSATQKIPESLIYEMVNGKPIYYKGYQDYIKGRKQLEQLMGSSKIQSFIITELVFLIRTLLGKEYFVLSNEIGLQFEKKSWRAADIAVIKKEKLKKLDNKYLDSPPEYVIEIDTKADLNQIENPLSYYQQKTNELLEFGVKRIIWIFTDTEKVMIANKDSKKWEILDWDQAIEIIPNLTINVQEILKDNNFLA